MSEAVAAEPQTSIPDALNVPDLEIDPQDQPARKLRQPRSENDAISILVDFSTLR